MNLIAEKIRRSNASEIHRGTGSNAGQRLQPGLRFSPSPLVVLFSFGTYDKRRCGIDNFVPMPIVKIKFEEWELKLQHFPADIVDRSRLARV